MSFDTEKGFISKLLETKDFKTVKDQQIKTSFFNGDNRRVYNYIQDIYSTTGEVPTPRAVSHKFPSYKFEKYNDEVGTEESLLFWCGELRAKVKHNKLADLIKDSADLINDENAEEAYSIIKKQIISIEQEVNISTSVNITEDIDERIIAYKKRKINQGITGIPSCFNSLDLATGGFNDETLTTIVAKTGIGKTFMEVILGAYCMLNDYKVLQFVTEMSTEKMRERYEAILFKMVRDINFNYNDYKRGRLDKGTENSFLEFLEKDLTSLYPLTLTQATDVMSIQAEIENIKPDIVFIDGAYLLQDVQGAKEDWLRMTHISRDLKILSKTLKLPIIINTQLDLNSKGGLGGIKYSQSISQDSDTVIEMFRDDVMFNDSEMQLKILKNREGTPAKILLSWDFKKMEFSEIFSEGLQGTEEKEEEPVNSNIIGID